MTKKFGWPLISQNLYAKKGIKCVMPPKVCYTIYSGGFGDKTDLSICWSKFNKEVS